MKFLYGFFPTIDFLDKLDQKLFKNYDLTFGLSAGVALIVLAGLIFLIVFLARSKKRKAKKQAKKEERLRGELADGGNYYPHDPEQAKPLLELEPEKQLITEAVFLENEPPYKSYGGTFVRLDIVDETLLDLIYERIIKDRDGISKSAFLEDKNYSKTYLDYVKERLMRLQIRGIGTQEALGIYFDNAPLTVPERVERRKNRISELEKQAIKQQISKASESDSETLMKYVTGLEKQIERLNEDLADSKDRKEKAETNRQIEELRNELNETRRKIQEKEEAERRREAEAAEAARRQETEAMQAALAAETARRQEAEAAAAAAIAASQKKQEPAKPVQAVIVPSEPSGPQYVDYSQRAEYMAQLRALMLLVHECRDSVKELDYRNAELYARRRTANRNELNGIFVEIQNCANEKAQLESDIKNANNSINEIIRILGLTNQDIMKIEEELFADKEEKAVPAAEPAKQPEPQNALDGEREEYKKRMREMEEERVAFFRDYAKNAQNQNNEAGNKDVIELNNQTADMETLRRRVPPGYVLLRRKDGSVALMKRSSLPSNVRVVNNLPERIVDILPDGTIVRADGSIVRPDGRVLRPTARPASASESDYRDVLLNERRELQKQRGQERRESVEDDEITKIETALKQGKKGR